jgi:hypothetical protein
MVGATYTKPDSDGLLLRGYGADARLLALDGDGDVVWHVDFRGQANNTPDYFNSVAAMPDGGALGVGYTSNPGIRQVYVGRASSNGKSLWSRTFGGAADDIGRGVTVLASGAFTVVASSLSTQPGNGDVLLRGMDPMGNTLWERVHGLTTEDVPAALLRRADGSLLVPAKGTKPGAAAADVAVWTFDAWGYGSCKDAGGCAAMPATGCDDANACTADIYTPTGCSHTPLTEGALCKLGKTCKKGSCSN